MDDDWANLAGETLMPRSSSGRLLAIGAACFLGAGCVTPARESSMRVAATPAARSEGVRVGSVEVTGGSATHPLWESRVSDDAFRGALERSLKDAGMLDAAGAGSSSRLLATIVEVAVHSSWLTHEFRANALVRYRLVAPDGRTLLEDSVASEGIAGFRDAPLGTTRARVVRERAMRNNIARFIERLRHTPPHAP